LRRDAVNSDEYELCWFGGLDDMVYITCNIFQHLTLGRWRRLVVSRYRVRHDDAYGSCDEKEAHAVLRMGSIVYNRVCVNVEIVAFVDLAIWAWFPDYAWKFDFKPAEKAVMLM
jgi:hypothetical protein